MLFRPTSRIPDVVLVYALVSMIQEDPANPQLIRALMARARSSSEESALADAIRRAGPGLIDARPIAGGGIPGRLPWRRRHLSAGSPAAPGLRLEQLGQPRKAVVIFNLLVTGWPGCPEAETASYKMAQCYWGVFRDARGARVAWRRWNAAFPMARCRNSARLWHANWRLPRRSSLPPEGNEKISKQ